MDDIDEIREMQGYFIEEAIELFENSHSILEEVEQKNELDADDIQALFRDIHTLKGGSGSVELTYFAKYVHYLENFLDNLRSEKLTPTPEMITFLIEELDTLEEMLTEESNGELDVESFNISLEELLKNIENLSNQEELNSEGISYQDEFTDLYNAVIDALESVEQSQSFSREFIASLFRYVHTLKGSSSFMSLVSFPKYLHNIEDLLDKARNNKIIYNNTFNDALLSSMKISEEIAIDEFNDSLDEADFELKLQEADELFSNIVEYTSNDTDVKNNYEEHPGFELFDFEDKKEEVKDNKEEQPGFELFDFEEQEQKEEENSKKEEKNEGFELFDLQEPKPKEIQKESVTKKQAAPKKKTKKRVKKLASGNSIRVGLDKIDFLMNRVGDLVITKSMLYKFLEDLAEKYDDPTIVDRLSRLDREIRELQEAVMSVRMIPMESVYAKFPKTIRDLAKKLNKKIEFLHHGDSVEIDKMMVEGINDPLVHIIRNSLDHGIEMPEQRVKKGKAEVGKLTISAAQESGHIIITIEDDGAGINLEKVVAKALENSIITQKEADLMSDEDKAMLIFSAGLSTANAVSDISGRGVGMDVVMNNITSLGGFITITTKKNKGSKFTILLPLTLAILDGLNVKIGKQQLIMPLNMIVESLQPSKNMIKKIGNDEKEILMLRNEFIPIIRLYDFFNIIPEFTDTTKGMLIITKITNVKVAIFVDGFLNQEQIVVKSLEKNYKKIKGISAATIRGDGSIGLILDILNIIEEEKIR